MTFAAGCSGLGRELDPTCDTDDVRALRPALLPPVVPLATAGIPAPVSKVAPARAEIRCAR